MRKIVAATIVAVSLLLAGAADAGCILGLSKVEQLEMYRGFKDVCNKDPKSPSLEYCKAWAKMEVAKITGKPVDVYPY